MDEVFAWESVRVTKEEERGQAPVDTADTQVFQVPVVKVVFVL